MNTIVKSFCESEAKAVRDPAAALIFPAIEPCIPDHLDAALARHCAGAWHHDVLGAARILRLELLQAAHPGRSFQDTLREAWQTWLLAGVVRGPMPSSAALAQARARFPIWALEGLFRHTASLAETWPRHPLCPEHRLLVVDGVPLSIPRTDANLKQFGITRSQHGDSHYPQASALWVSCLPSRIVVLQALGTARESDQCVSPRHLPKALQPGDLVLGDAHFGTFPNLTVIQRANAFHLVRASGTFRPDIHCVGRAGPDDLDLRVEPSSYIRSAYRHLPVPPELPTRAVTIEVPARDELNRVIPAIFLTNLPRSTFPRKRLAELTALRWSQETMHNDIKTRLGLGEMRSLNPEGVYREVLAHLCLSSILRILLLGAHRTAPWEGSFTAAKSALLQANQQLRLAPQRREQILAAELGMIRDQPLDVRPGRSEPRMKRPSRHPYATFKTPRAEWRKARRAG